MAIKYDERLIQPFKLDDTMTMVIDGELVAVEDVVQHLNQGLTDVKLKGVWSYYDLAGTVTIAENIREEAAGE